MKNELIIIDSLNQESDKISKISNPSFHNLRHSAPTYDLSGWNEETPQIKVKDLQYKTEIKQYQNSKDSKISNFKHRSQPQSSECLRNKNLNPIEVKISQRRSSQVIKKSITPTIYKVHKIYFEQPTLPTSYRPSIPNDKPIKLINKRKSNFLKKRASFVKQSNDLSVIEELLKPETKNPVKSVVETRLKSRSEQYRPFYKHSKSKRLSFACLDFNPLDPLHISSKSFNPN